MTRHFGLLALLAVAVLFAGCGAKDDTAAKKWAEFLHRQQISVDAGTFKADEFKKEGQPLADELVKAKKAASLGTLNLSDEVREEMKKAETEFEEAFMKHNDKAAATAYNEVTAELHKVDNKGKQ